MDHGSHHSKVISFDDLFVKVISWWLKPFYCVFNFRVREFWHEPPSVDVISRLQRKELSLFKAAEILNVTVTTLANYLAVLGKEGYSKPVNSENGSEDSDSVASAQQALSQNPDITIVKKEIFDDIPSNVTTTTGSTAASSPPASLNPSAPSVTTLPTCLNGNNT